MKFVAQGFEKLLSSPWRKHYHAIWQEFAVASQQMMQQRGYFAARDAWFAKIDRYLTAPEHRFFPLHQILYSKARQENPAASDGFFLSTVDEILSFQCETNDVARQFLAQLRCFVAHDVSHNSPYACIRYLLNDLIEKQLGGYYHHPERELPASIVQKLQTFFDNRAIYAAFYEAHVEIGSAFFSPPAELGAMKMLGAEELKSLLVAIACGQALRFARADFEVVTGEQGQAKVPAGNVICIKVDPKLNIELPMILLMPKMAANIKNAVRIVANKETGRFAHDQQDPLRGCSLVQHMRGQSTEKPVAIVVEARSINDQIWELRTSDNGRGIIVEQLFPALCAAAARFPAAISPALSRAVRQWEAGDALAFNNIPYGDLLEAVYQLGVTTGAGSGSVGQATGMGLWGTMALLIKLGARVRVGVNPQTGGFYESILLPTRLSALSRAIRAPALAA
ncbi:MAG: hypothetical protein QME05_06850 [Candidatus Margulisbacteria bacterium]|nr:hypothetical protein [Candidatus Margulisiibacteriota bacterium]